MSGRGDPQRAEYYAAVARNVMRLVAEDGRSMRAIEIDGGLVNNAISRLLNGKSGITLYTAQRLCECLCCTMDDLTDGAGSMIKARPWLKGPGR